MKPSKFLISADSRNPLRFTETQASVLLDLVRGVAAILVLLEHWHHIFFFDFGQLTTHRKLLALPYLIVSAGHQAVVIFFVLSGYLISGSVFRMFSNGTWSWGTYGLHRLVRLWIVLLPALLLTVVCDRFGMHLHRATAIELYTGHGGSRILHNVTLNSSPTIWFGNLFFLQDVVVPVFGSNGPLWSLANEFWYYVLFPLGLIAVRPGGRWPSRLAYGAAFLLVAYLLRGGIINGLPVWLLGTILALLPPLAIDVKWRWLSAVVYIPIFYGFSKWTSLPVTYSDWMLGIVTMVFLWILISTGAKRSSGGTSTRGIRTLARFSYTIYLVHLPLLALTAALVLGPSRWQPDMVHTVAGIGILLFVIAFAFIVATATEFKTDQLRSFIERRWEMADVSKR
jgi:peptidoglycan/LPS O-acetylase OafA/YrhL